jgi:hypothetical protein
VSSSKFTLPEPSFTLVHREDEGASVYAAVNTSLVSLDTSARQLYSWQLSLILELQTEDAQGMTLSHEAKAIEPFCLQLESDLLASGNALPLARITWRKTRELLFRVYNPAIANDLIEGIIAAESNPRPFSYAIDPDEEWIMAKVYLHQFETQSF